MNYTYIFHHNLNDIEKKEQKFADYLVKRNILAYHNYRDTDGGQKAFSAMIGELKRTRQKAVVYYLYGCCSSHPHGISFLPAAYGATIRIVPFKNTADELRLIRELERAADEIKQSIGDIFSI